MTINFECSNCGKAYRLSDELAGKKARCKACDAVIVIPSNDGFEEVVDKDLIEEQDGDAEGYDFAPRSSKRSRPIRRDADDRSSQSSKSKLKNKGKKSSKTSVWSSPWTWVGIAGGGLLTCVLICCGGVPFLIQKSLISKSGVAVNKVPMGPATSLMPVSQIPIPQFPDPGNSAGSRTIRSQSLFDQAARRAWRRTRSFHVDASLPSRRRPSAEVDSVRSDRPRRFNTASREFDR
ncbi:MAG: hypothetical protein FJ267_14440 [Planctomycetes bacterium]|nr:hypothetical protein [Planctomycetota bacterium]